MRRQNTQLVEVVLGLRPLEVVQRRLGLAPVVQQVREVDPRFGEARLQLQRAAQPVERARIVAQAVRRVP